MALGVVDYIVFGSMLLISAGIGIYYRLSGGKQSTTEEYLLGGKNQSILPVAFSLVATFASSISILGYISEVYNFGTHFFVINVAYLFSTPIAVFFYLPVFFKIGAVSVYEYLEKRFGILTRTLASLAFTVQMVLYMGVVHYAPALAVEAVTGIPELWSIVAIGLICIFYSTIGGIKAVIYSDLFQTLLMFAAVFAIIIVTIVDTGSFSEIWNETYARGRIQFSNFDPDPTERYTWWTVIIGGFFTHITLYAVNQAQVQRYVSMSSYKSAALSLMATLPTLIGFMVSLCVAGVCIFYYYRNCDPLRIGRVTTADQLVPLYVMDRFSTIPGLTGLFVSGIFSASLSTVSAAVNSLAAVTLEDYIKPVYKYRYKMDLNTDNASLSKCLAFAYGFICLGVALLLREYGSIAQTCITIFGVVGGPLFALFTAGMFIPCVNEFGAVLGFLIGLAFCFAVGFGGPKPMPVKLPTSIEGCFNETVTRSPFFDGSISTPVTTIIDSNADGAQYFYLFRISHMYYVVLGFITTFVLSILFSLIRADPDAEPNPDLFTPPVAKMLRKRKRTQETVYVYDLKTIGALGT